MVAEALKVSYCIEQLRNLALLNRSQLLLTHFYNEIVQFVIVFVDQCFLCLNLLELFLIVVPQQIDGAQKIFLGDLKHLQCRRIRLFQSNRGIVQQAVVQTVDLIHILLFITLLRHQQIADLFNQLVSEQKKGGCQHTHSGIQKGDRQHRAALVHEFQTEDHPQGNV